MKQLLSSTFILLSISVFGQTTATQKQVPAAQQSSEVQTNSRIENHQPSEVKDNPRTAASSARVNVTPTVKLPYDVNDKYMGRRDEFLNSMIVSELPSDFPVYDKQWGVKEYNAVVDAYCMKHMDILKDRVKEKIQSLINEQQQQTK
jgi:hypothetical protein